ncbi:hypothetical protein EV361DRAFT_193498 [Lentinula raphanica]|uniref:Uncharacterized protein n=1 Tax=Lentinula raphanica TaxID=153919 RepID=A0AA38UKF6_9AGAR|nr:hypothetical protein FB446DRAFT_455020 [Lentinula raphanica]KAJ3830642.1 hypothetical protein F5880DRAFT_343324 [Lentinula raphanica]KAJ3844559.1 hypothetical protein F5878DRAFT_95766 [Lentinula raphanica]KAJ3976860.1 hypothetical protein EV361DRAFT_193498 [Lentinula raphanica]
MTARRAENAPWPRQTQPPVSTKRSSKRRKVDSDISSTAGSSLSSRQALESQVESAENQCDLLSGNDIESCFPTSDSVFAQSEFVTFVWNSRLPSYAQTNKVNIYLFHGDSNEQILEIPNVDNSNNQAGVITVQANDSWWGSNGPDFSGTNTSYPFYFGITPNTTTFDAAAHTQTHFTAVQTTFPDSILSSMSASSASASSASVSSASAASVSSASASRASASAAASSSGAAGATSSSGSSNGSGNIQSGDSSGGFPHWAIAVIVVLGFLAIASSCLLAFFIMRRLRRKRELDSNRNSMGSSSPMMAHVQSPGSPLLAGAGEGPSSTGHGATGLQRAPSVVSPDGASSISHGGSAGEGGPFSGADAAIIANAFRTMLRKPDFADAPVEEGESPDSQEPGRVELNRELAEEGRDIRSVSSSRGVRVETLSDDGDTIQEGH